MNYSTSIRFFFVLGLTFLCWALSFFLHSVIMDRSVHEQEAQNSVRNSWANPQLLVGPSILLPYQNAAGKKEYFVILPDLLKSHSRIETEKRHRGIFQVPVYNAHNSFEGHFNLAPIVNNKTITLLPKEATIIFNINDPRGIQSCTASVNNEIVHFEPGIKPNNFASGIHASLPSLSPHMYFKFSLNIRGTAQFKVAPVGKISTCTMQGTWLHPSFVGGILPKAHSITAKEFNASWDVSYLSRSYAQVISFDPQDKANPFCMGDSFEDMSNSKIGTTAFGVKFVNPIDLYSLCLRSIKYAILFISLTFLALFIFETRRKIIIHPVQYVLVGTSLCVFPLLLTSLGEHLGFMTAYFLGAIMVAGQITTYTHFILGNRCDAYIIGSILLGLYAYLYCMLQLEDMALLIGSLGLFIILTILMFFSRKIVEPPLAEIKIN